jgi:hypothetical protein
METVDCLGCNRLEIAPVTLQDGRVICDQCQNAPSNQAGNGPAAGIEGRGAIQAGSVSGFALPLKSPQNRPVPAIPA